MGCCCSTIKKKRPVRVSSMNMLRGYKDSRIEIHSIATIRPPPLSWLSSSSSSSSLSSSSLLSPLLSPSSSLPLLLTDADILITGVLSLLTVSSASISIKDMILSECCICIDNVARIRINPCYHACLCENCYINFIKQKKVTCPLCRKKLSKMEPLIYDK